jgi:hypothetical protein
LLGKQFMMFFGFKGISHEGIDDVGSLGIQELAPSCREDTVLKVELFVIAIFGNVGDSHQLHRINLLSTIRVISALSIVCSMFDGVVADLKELTLSASILKFRESKWFVITKWGKLKLCGKCEEREVEGRR